MGAGVYQLGQLSYLMLFPLERIHVTFSLKNTNPWSVCKILMLLGRGHAVCLGRHFWKIKFSAIFREAAERLLLLLELEGSGQRKHPLPPAFTVISPVPVALIDLASFNFYFNKIVSFSIAPCLWSYATDYWPVIWQI